MSETIRLGMTCLGPSTPYAELVVDHEPHRQTRLQGDVVVTIRVIGRISDHTTVEELSDARAGELELPALDQRVLDHHDFLRSLECEERALGKHDDVFAGWRRDKVDITRLGVSLRPDDRLEVVDHISPEEILVEGVEIHLQTPESGEI
jgi:hypothetical protein